MGHIEATFLYSGGRKEADIEEAAEKKEDGEGGVRVNDLREGSADTDLSQGGGVNVAKRNADGEALKKHHRQDNHGGIPIPRFGTGPHERSMQPGPTRPSEGFRSTSHKKKTKKSNRGRKSSIKLQE